MDGGEKSAAEMVGDMIHIDTAEHDVEIFRKSKINSPRASEIPQQFKEN